MKGLNACDMDREVSSLSMLGTGTPEGLTIMRLVPATVVIPVIVTPGIAIAKVRPRSKPVGVHWAAVVPGLSGCAD